MDARLRARVSRKRGRIVGGFRHLRGRSVHVPRAGAGDGVLLRLPAASRAARRRREAARRQIRSAHFSRHDPGAGSLAAGFDEEGRPRGLTSKGGRMRIRIAVAPAPPPVADPAIEFNESMTMPSMVSGPSPEYTPDAVERGIEGSMQVRCVITADGQVRSCKVLKGLPFMNGAVVGALERRKYRAALAQGNPVDVYYTFNIRLKLPPR